MGEAQWVDYSLARPDVTGFAGAMRYLQIRTDGTKGLEAEEIVRLLGAGVPIGLVWETQASAALGGSVVATDHVTRANKEADRIGAPKDVAIFYCIDFDAAPAQVDAYVQQLMKLPGRPVGIYGSYRITTWARNMGVKWTWQTAAWSAHLIDGSANLYQRDFLDNSDISVEQNIFPAWGRPLPTSAPTTSGGESLVVAIDQINHPVVLWRGVVVCAHSVPKLNAWAASVGAGIRLTPLAGCGSYQTSTKASAGTHAGGGAIDISLVNVPADKRKWVADQGRLHGLQISYHRNAITGLWTWHCHALDPACSKLASAAVGQCVECFAGGDGLVGSTPDANTRANIPALKTIFANRLKAPVVVKPPTTTTPVVKPVAVSDTDRVKLIQKNIRVWTGVNGIWDLQTDIDARNTRAVAKENYTGAYFKKFALAQRKRMQQTWGTTQDGIWGPKTKSAAWAAVGGIQLALGVKTDHAWGPVTEAAYVALRSRKWAACDLAKPYGTFPAPKASCMYGPSVAGKPWFSGRTAGTLTAGQIQWHIRRIQRMVGVTADGIYGSTTTTAVSRWQKAHAIGADGIVGPTTWAAMSKVNKA